MLGSTNPAPRAGWMGGALALALATGGCGAKVVVDSPGSGGATSTGAGTGGSTNVTAVAGTSTTAASSSSTGLGAACDPPCGFMITCCQGTCAELDNDLLNCGGCGIVCPGEHPYCHMGMCEPEPTCMQGQPCPSSDFCCGQQCCAADEICCDRYGGPAQPNPHCEKPENGTCGKSCFECD